ncbi:MAG TPA: porin [Caulobacteraceae bacterium]
MGDRIARHAALAGGIACGVMLLATGAFAADMSAEDARIARLEAAVASLQAQVQAQSGVARENLALKRQVDDLETQVAALKTTPATSATAPPPSSLAASLAGGVPHVATADGEFSLNLHSIVQLDTAAYFQDPPGPIATDLRRSGPALGFTSSNVDVSHARELKDGTNLRRARIGVDGNAFGDFQYKLVFDFGGSGVENAGQLYEGWAQYSGLDPLKLRIGVFAPLEGLADQDSPAAQPLLDRPASADIARGFAAGEARIAAEVFGAGDHWLASAAVTGRTVGVINTGSPTGAPQTYSDPLAFVGRLAATPLYGDDWRIHFGVHASWLDRPANISGPPAAFATPVAEVVAFSDQAELRVDGTKLINTGAIDAKHADEEGAEFAAQWRGLLVQSEYDRFHVQRTASGVTDPHFEGWYVEGSWVLTGQARRYNAQTAAFDAPPVSRGVGAGGFGVVELALRYADMNLDYHAGSPGSAPAADAIRGGDLETWSAGLNWYLNSVVRLALEGQHVNLQRLSPDAKTYQTPLGAQIGQSFNTVAVRSQLAF